MEEPRFWPIGGEFSMLTVNADGFPVLKRFHKPSDEKRKRAARKDKNLRTAENCCCKRCRNSLPVQSLKLR
jgi:hypothetical protein